MGMTKVEVELTNPQRPERTSKLQLLVDSVATYSIVSAKVLEGLAIRPLERRKFVLANGQEIERDVGGALLKVAGRAGFASVKFGHPSDQEVLGVTALEELGLELDPVNKELRPMRLYLV